MQFVATAADTCQSGLVSASCLPPNLLLFRFTLVLLELSYPAYISRVVWLSLGLLFLLCFVSWRCLFKALAIISILFSIYNALFAHQYTYFMQSCMYVCVCINTCVVARIRSQHIIVVLEAG